MRSTSKIVWTSEQDAAIRRVYERRERGAARALARQWAISPRRISVRAAELGLPPLIASVSRQHPLSWQKSELEIMRAHSGEPAAQIRARLYAKGHYRSLPAIRSCVSRLRKEGTTPEREMFFELRNRLTTTAIAEGLGVSPTTVIEWARKGWLPSQQTATKTLRTVRYKDLRRFLIDYVAHWDHRKADRWFLVDVLTNGLAESGECKEAAV